MICKDCGSTNIEKPKKKYRSNQYNKFFFATLIDPLADHTGDDPKSLYGHLKSMFLVPADGRIVPDGTSEMSPQELTKFIDRIVSFAAEFHSFIYDPNNIQELMDSYEAPMPEFNG